MKKLDWFDVAIFLKNTPKKKETIYTKIENMDISNQKFIKLRMLLDTYLHLTLKDYYDENQKINNILSNLGPGFKWNKPDTVKKHLSKLAKLIKGELDEDIW